jgi:hypothetical protein
VHGRLLAASDPERAATLLGDAAREYEELDVPGLAERARELVSA